ncbi:2-amino-4-hydroxy-6-hydroxymethyldihydropteridinediphosphokinase [Solimonas aquatica]|uniref:2-amino-4-hydroxy-6-hydroxymethyldihydropteridine pyrophosphokinase n=1 Tax=Solimonas aquatica TaxID=489703 RepID=A0A1H9D027_9GAMM|nr:2-amino-4-hydroxy-6-hydroxymethyldihydropteridine diphosphokinase [Solimonas aquatica]SEQ06852.1 2-amino-4-hydroxy-6-hydroxymethyldihydropteridinediphosphokinase [Solimonas aquatica]
MSPRFRAHIGLGANLGDPPAQLRWALARLEQLGRLLAQSPLYRSLPMGPSEQPDFCNAVCILDTDIPPEALMQALLAIEREAGRVRDVKWGPRTLDLDLLHVEGVVLDSAALRLPHPGIAQRNFVLQPWAQIAPDLVVPGLGRVDLAAGRLGEAGLQLWRE